jgi:hypothetical protein
MGATHDRGPPASRQPPERRFGAPPPAAQTPSGSVRCESPTRGSFVFGCRVLGPPEHRDLGVAGSRSLPLNPAEGRQVLGARSPRDRFAARGRWCPLHGSIAPREGDLKAHRRTNDGPSAARRPSKGRNLPRRGRTDQRRGPVPRTTFGPSGRLGGPSSKQVAGRPQIRIWEQP